MMSKNPQQGFSLVELMIAITLGMVLMGAALQFMVSTRQTYELNDDISRIQENGRIALDIMVKDLQMAGYRAPMNGDGKVPDFFLKETTVAGSFLQDGGGANSDRLAIQFDPPPDDGTEVDCLGNPVAAGNLLVNVYTINDLDGDGISSLYCRGFDSTNGNWIGGGPQPLVDGIDNMQVLYRVSDPSVTPTTYRYISGDQLALADYPNILAARVALLVSSGTAQGSAENKLRSFRVLDSSQIDITDRQPRRIYSTTVQFNNRTF